MNVLGYILADSESAITKLIFFVVFAIIWGVAWLISTIAKKQEEERRRRVREQIQRGMSTVPPMTSRAPSGPLPQMPLQRPVTVRPGVPPMRVIRQQQQPPPPPPA